ncbi:hypothetical protein ACFL08_02215 [Patescibacteria group bacterium]
MNVEKYGDVLRLGNRFTCFNTRMIAELYGVEKKWNCFCGCSGVVQHIRGMWNEYDSCTDEFFSSSRKFEILNRLLKAAIKLSDLKLMRKIRIESLTIDAHLREELQESLKKAILEEVRQRRDVSHLWAEYFFYGSEDAEVKSIPSEIFALARGSASLSTMKKIFEAKTGEVSEEEIAASMVMCINKRLSDPHSEMINLIHAVAFIPNKLNSLILKSDLFERIANVIMDREIHRGNAHAVIEGYRVVKDNGIIFQDSFRINIFRKTVNFVLPIAIRNRDIELMLKLYHFFPSDKETEFFSLHDLKRGIVFALSERHALISNHKEAKKSMWANYRIIPKELIAERREVLTVMLKESMRIGDIANLDVILSTEEIKASKLETECLTSRAKFVDKSFKEARASRNITLLWKVYYWRKEEDEKVKVLRIIAEEARESMSYKLVEDLLLNINLSRSIKAKNLFFEDILDLALRMNWQKLAWEAYDQVRGYSELAELDRKMTRKIVDNL